jgi:hypothetical protein
LLLLLLLLVLILWANPREQNTHLLCHHLFLITQSVE